MKKRGFLVLSFCIGIASWLGACDPAPARDSTIIYDDHDFVNAGAFDFQLSNGSPCVDVGRNASTVAVGDLLGKGGLVAGSRKFITNAVGTPQALYLPLVVRGVVYTPTPTPLPSGAVALVTIGDSLTAGDCDDYGGFSTRLSSQIQVLRPGSTLNNYGLSGWTSDNVILGNGGEPAQLNQALTRINQALADGQLPIVTVWIGSNDLWYLYEYGDPTPANETADLAHYTANMDVILSQLTDSGAAVFIALLDDQSLRPVCANPAMRAAAFPGISDAEVARMSQQTARYNTAITSKAAQYGATTVNFYNTSIFTTPATLCEDGNHPNAAGYDAITQIWFNTISPLLE